jgi:hypothetical protein
MSEYELQCSIVDYLEILKSQNVVTQFSSIPNSTFTRSWSQKMKNKKSGVRPGLPDLFILIESEAFFVELKTEKGTLQATQKEWIRNLDKSSTKAYIVTSLEEFKVLIYDIVSSQKKPLKIEDTQYYKNNLKGARLFKKLI